MKFYKFISITFLFATLIGCENDMTFYKKEWDPEKKICKDEIQMKVVFVVNSEKQLVLRKNYHIDKNGNESLIYTDFLTNCQFLDKNNFKCRDNSSYSYAVSDEKFILFNEENFVNDPMIYKCWFRNTFKERLFNR